jgi:hypothetical protein
MLSVAWGRGPGGENATMGGMSGHLYDRLLATCAVCAVLSLACSLACICVLQDGRKAVEHSVRVLTAHLFM